VFCCCIFCSLLYFRKFRILWKLEVASGKVLSVVFHGPDSNTGLTTSMIAVDFSSLLGQMTEAISVCTHLADQEEFLFLHCYYLSLQKGCSKCCCTAKTERGLSMIELRKRQSVIINKLCFI